MARSQRLVLADQPDTYTVLVAHGEIHRLRSTQTG